MHNTKQPNIILRYWLIALSFAAAGLLIALYSAHSHYQNYIDPLYSSFCRGTIFPTTYARTAPVAEFPGGQPEWYVLFCAVQYS